MTFDLQPIGDHSENEMPNTLIIGQANNWPISFSWP